MGCNGSICAAIARGLAGRAVSRPPRCGIAPAAKFERTAAQAVRNGTRRLAIQIGRKAELLLYASGCLSAALRPGNSLVRDTTDKIDLNAEAKDYHVVSRARIRRTTRS